MRQGRDRKSKLVNTLQASLAPKIMQCAKKMLFTNVKHLGLKK